MMAGTAPRTSPVLPVSFTGHVWGVVEFQICLSFVFLLQLTSVLLPHTLLSAMLPLLCTLHQWWLLGLHETAAVLKGEVVSPVSEELSLRASFPNDS